jgi:hypothetical protein
MSLYLEKYWDTIVLFEGTYLQRYVCLAVAESFPVTGFINLAHFARPRHTLQFRQPARTDVFSTTLFSLIFFIFFSTYIYGCNIQNLKTPFSNFGECLKITIFKSMRVPEDNYEPRVCLRINLPLPISTADLAYSEPWTTYSWAPFFRNFNKNIST